MRVRMLKGPDKGKICDMPTMMTRAALKAGKVEVVAEDRCPRCAGLIAEVPTLSTEPNRFQCQTCGAARVEAPAPLPEEKPPEPPSEEKPRLGRRSRRARRAGAGADE